MSVTKLNHMSAEMQKQLQFEIGYWRQLLGFMMEENIHHKNSLSMLLKGNLHESLLEEIDSFHSRFIREDNVIRFLRNNIAELDMLSSSENFKGGLLPDDVQKEIKILRKNMTNSSKDFCDLKNEFSNFLLENIFYP